MTTQHLTEDDLVLHYYGETLATDERQRAGAPVGVRRVPARVHAAAARAGVVDESAVAIDLPPASSGRCGHGSSPNLQPARRGWLSWLLTSPGAARAGRRRRRARGRGVLRRRRLSPADNAARGDCGRDAGRAGARADPARRSRRAPRSIADGARRARERGPTTPVRTSRGEQSRAEQLVAANRLYRQTAATTGDVGDRRAARRARARARRGRGESGRPDRRRSSTDVRRRIESQGICCSRSAWCRRRCANVRKHAIQRQARARSLTADREEPSISHRRQHRHVAAPTESSDAENMD